MIRSALALLFFLASAQTGGAGPAERAIEAARALDAAAERMAEASTGRDRITALSETIQAYEDGLVALREGLREAQLREAALSRRFSAAGEDLSRLLSVLIATDRIDPELALLHPDGALETARAAMLLGEVSPVLAREVASLREDLEDLRALRRARQFGLLSLEQGLETAQGARVALSQAIADRGPLPQRLVDTPDYLEALARDSASLQDFADDLAQRTALGDSTPVASFTAARGALDLPVRAVLLHRFGQPDAAGIARDGLVLATAPEALVTAPWSATVRYSGPLSGHGQVIILEPAESILMVLSGLGETLVRTGEIIPMSTPLGSMPATQRADAGAGSRSETLYFEMRQDGNPIDPEPWFAFSGTQE